jgi:ketosteroid isomerase-like protein
MLAVIALAGSVSADSQGDAVEKEVTQLFHLLNNAGIKKDRTTWERMTAEDFLYIHSNGSVTDKSQESAALTLSDTGWTGTKIDDLKVRIYGDVAIVTGLNTLTGSAAGYLPGARRFTDVWVKRDKVWRNVGGQSTLAQQ